MELEHATTRDDATPRHGSARAAVACRELVASVTCPHCWTEFPPSQVRFIAEHPSLRGDAVLGTSEALRFLPSRFDDRGHAIDPLGATATRLACRRCHLEIPMAALECPQLVVSIVGAPASGKSVMLAASAFSLRSGLVVPGLEFLDADPALNDLTVELESSLFRASNPEQPAMIAKTDISGRLYRSFRVGDATVTAPKPQLFTVARRGRRRLLALYDNAGEHFLPGTDPAQEPVTRHLAVSRALVFVIDPTQDHRVAERLGGRTSVAELGGGGGVEQRQDLVLIEVANRVRRLRALTASEPLPFRIVLALAKSDLWGHLCDPAIGPTSAGEVGTIAVPDAPALARMHASCAEFLRATMPEVVATAAALDPRFRLVPFSGLGRPPAREAGGQRLAIRPRDLRPQWPAAPLVAALSEADPGILPEYLEAAATSGEAR